MSSFHKNSSYMEDPDYPGYSGSQNHTQNYLRTQDDLEFPGCLDNPGFHHPRRNPYSSDSRTNPDYHHSLAEPDYPGSPSDADYQNTRCHPRSAHPRTRPDYEPDYEPDYNDFQSESYHPDLSMEPDYPGSHGHPGFAGVRSSVNSTGPRTNLGYLDLEEPDYPGAQGNSYHSGPRSHSNLPGSRRNAGYAGSRINSYPDSLGEPDYPGAENQPNSPDFYGKPDYPGAEEGDVYSPSKTLGVIGR